MTFIGRRSEILFSRFHFTCRKIKLAVKQSGSKIVCMSALFIYNFVSIGILINNNLEIVSPPPLQVALWTKSEVMKLNY